MKCVFYTNIVSPHQLPWCRELVKIVGKENFLYMASEALHKERKALGWEQEKEYWCIQGDHENKCLKEADIVISGLREIDLFEKRLKENKLTIYSSERWFKPRIGFFRLLVPFYFRMAGRFIKLFSYAQFYYYAMGIHAARDMVRLYQFFQGNISSLFTVPEVAFESYPGGSIIPLKEAISAGILQEEDILFAKQHGFVQIPKIHWGKIRPTGIWEKIKLWGYFVEPSTALSVSDFSNIPLKILWVGRMLKLKQIDTIIKAVQRNTGDKKIELHLYGHGTEEKSLKKLALGHPVFFHAAVSITEVRKLMQTHDVYVLSSNAFEGWGAVVNEAMSEGMISVGTVEAGSSATMIEHGKNGFLYRAKNIKELECILEQIWNQKQSGKVQKIRNNAKQTLRDIWSPKNAAVKLLEDCNRWINQ